ncbi:MAG: Crp/Fnr family transcriptional regulator [Bacteroidota bacterium]|nr:Crp/Fnr family transcriptional regulator [Bacteroidota bacterium]
MLELNQKEWDAFSNIFVFRSVPKKCRLTDAGEIAREAYFINKGLARLYFLKEGEEINANFVFENGFITSFESFLLQNQSRQVVETLEESELLVLRKHKLDELTKAFPKFNIFNKIMAEQAFFMLQRRASSFILDSAEQRYLDMVQQRPNILERIPQHMIASYLGVTPVSLSRIRKRISGE